MKGEYGKYYLLDIAKEYFSVDLQRKIKFSGVPGTLAVKCGSSFGKDCHFGTLVASEKMGPDYDTKNEIEYCDSDITGIYQLKDMPLFYMDFSNMFKYGNS